MKELAHSAPLTITEPIYVGVYIMINWSNCNMEGQVLTGKANATYNLWRDREGEYKQRHFECVERYLADLNILSPSQFINLYKFNVMENQLDVRNSKT